MKLVYSVADQKNQKKNMLEKNREMQPNILTDTLSGQCFQQNNGKG